MKVVVVESPSKARKINSWLGPGHRVLASFGHVRDLPSRNGSVDPGNEFAMLWEEDAQSKPHLRDIAQAVKGADTLVLATDPDREGEAISWHLLDAMRQRRVLSGTKVQRVAFNAVTRDAVLKAMRQPREIDQPLVDAYLARRALDYLVGFTLSPVLWRKLHSGARSAGRVQSVALRLVCEREWSIAAFVSEEYWHVDAQMQARDGSEFSARLKVLDGEKLGRQSLATEAAAQAALRVVRGGEESVRGGEESVRGGEESVHYSVRATEAKPVRRSPPPPFITSTLQKDASRKLGLSAKRCMQVAQSLYEAGRITYMRTDGVDMAPEAISAARAAIEQGFGPDYLPERPRVFKSKSANAQEAHEAIRPTDFGHAPAAARGGSDDDRLYALIWQRAVASQMADARFERTTIDLVSANQRAELHAAGDVQLFDGFGALYSEGRDPQHARQPAAARLPRLAVGEAVKLVSADCTQHFTKPPSRYTEASLVSQLEKLGIGRPSTYASTLSTLRDRNYVRLEKKFLVPEETGHIVTAFLKAHFARYVDYEFTRKLEQELDVISNAKLDWKAFLARFWVKFERNVCETGELPPQTIIERMNEALSKYLFLTTGPTGEVVEEPRSCPACGAGQLSVRLSAGGAFVGCSRHPQCSFARSLEGDAMDHVPELATPAANNAYSQARLLGTQPRSNKPVTLCDGPYGPYVQLGDSQDKPRRASLPRSWPASSIDLERALKLLALPRKVGAHPEGGNIVAQFGPHGPYVKHDRTYADLRSEDDVFSVTVEQALALLANRRPSASKPTRTKPSRDKPPRNKSSRKKATGNKQTSNAGKGPATSKKKSTRKTGVRKAARRRSS